MTREQANALVYLYGIDLSQDFHALPHSQIEKILAAADDYRYRPPENRNGSRARYFHAFLKRKLT